MIKIKDLLDVLSDVIIYIVTGYTFIKTFKFVSLKQNTMDIENMLTSSLIVGFVFVLSGYSIIRDDKIIEDFSNNLTKVVILDTSTAKRVEIQYYENSEKCKDIKMLFDSYNSLFCDKDS